MARIAFLLIAFIKALVMGAMDLAVFPAEFPASRIGLNSYEMFVKKGRRL